MKNTITLLTTLLVMGFLNLLIAQEPQDRMIQFDKTTHDFGDVEHGAPTETVFTFTNVSDNPVTLKNVRASCGCTTPNWTRDEVKPGETGEIKVKYNSYRTGRFTKAVTVTYDSVERPLVLYIKGNVAPKQPSDADTYQVPNGNLSFDRMDANLGSFNSDQNQSVDFLVKNTGTQAVTFTGEWEAGDMIKEVRPTMYRLEPGQKGAVKVVIDTDYFEKTETFSTEVKLETDDPDNKEKVLRVSGRVNKVYSAEELAKMPNIEFASTTYEGGEVIEGEKLNAVFTFTNTGGSDLNIENVRASCGCTATEPKDKVIPPGGTSEIRATFDSRGRPGKQVKSITVRTNDPDSGTIMLRLECEVVRDPFHMGGNATPIAKPKR